MDGGTAIATFALLSGFHEHLELIHEGISKSLSETSFPESAWSLLVPKNIIFLSRT